MAAKTPDQNTKALRAALGLTQERFAAKGGVTVPIVNRWENGKGTSPAAGPATHRSTLAGSAKEGCEVMAAMRAACSESAPLRQPADRWSGFDRKVLMPIRTTRRAKWRDRREGIEKQELEAFGVQFPKASYADRKASPRVLCGSI